MIPHPFLTLPCIIDQWRSFTENKKASGFAGVLAADNAEFTVKVHHLTSYGLAVLTPAALILSPSMLNVPVDLALGCLIPIHSHIGMNGVISDYIPKPMQGSVRLVWMGITSIVFFGILRLNIQGPGFTESIKSIWREPEEKK